MAKKEVVVHFLKIDSSDPFRALCYKYETKRKEFVYERLEALIDYTKTPHYFGENSIWWIINNRTDVNQIHLPAKPFVRRVDGNKFAIGRKTRMQIDPENSRIGSKQSSA